jgi:hypothetical protein
MHGPNLTLNLMFHLFCSPLYNWLIKVNVKPDKIS